MLPTTVRVQIRFADFDPLNHVNNVAYFELMETARIEAFRELPGTVRGHIVVRHAECDYVAEIRGGTRAVDVVVSVEKVGTTSFTVRQEIHAEGRVAGVGRATLVVLGDARRPRPLTEDERDALGAGVPVRP